MRSAAGAEHLRVPEAVSLQPTRPAAAPLRGPFAGDRLQGRVCRLLQQAVDDLEQPDELRELGMALFLDRPFGSGKAPTDPDATLLLSYEALSPTVAGRRLEYLSGTLHVPAEAVARHRQRLHAHGTAGAQYAQVDTLPAAARPGVVSLADARQAAPDFLLLRTHRPLGARRFLELYDFGSLRDRGGLDWLASDRRLLLVGGAAPGGPVTVYDAELRPRLELTFDPAAGYTSRAGVEFPSSSLQTLVLDPG